MSLRTLFIIIAMIYGLVFMSKKVANNLNERLFHETTTETTFFN